MIVSASTSIAKILAPFSAVARRGSPTPVSRVSAGQWRGAQTPGVAVRVVREAAKREDALNYTEPPDWINPAHEALGGVLLRAKRYAEAEQAFRADLRRDPRSGRSLFGLMQSLQAQGRTYDAQLVGQQFNASWRHADAKLRVDDL